MDDELFEKFNEQNNKTDFPKIAVPAALSLFYKKKIGNQVLYTSVVDGKISSFQEADYQVAHQNAAFELMYVLEGSLINVLNQQEFIFSAGDACFLNPQMAHFEKMGDNSSAVFVNCSLELLEEILEKISESGLLFTFLKEGVKSENLWQRRYLQITKNLPYENRVVRIILDSLQQEIATNKIGKEYLQKGLLLRLFDALENPHRFSLQEFDLDNSKEAYLINRLIYQIEHHFGNISRDQIEEILHYNAEYLNRLLKKHTSKTISNYSQEIRLKNAKNLLTTTDLTIQLIATELGFKNETYFYQFFKKQTHLSPNKFRDNYKEKQGLV